MRFRRRRPAGPSEVVILPDWAKLVDVESGRVLVAGAPEIDVRGLDVLGQGADEENDVGRIAEVAVDYFGGGYRAAPPEPSKGAQLPIPPPPPKLRLVSCAPEVEARVSLFGDDVADEDEDDDG